MISITGQKFSKCLKNGSDRLRKGLLRGQPKIFKAKPGTFKKTRPSPHAQETIPFPTHPPPPPLRPLPEPNLVVNLPLGLTNGSAC